MGTIFEPAFGGFPLTGSYENRCFTSFGPPVEFEAGYHQPEQWRVERQYSSETALSSETSDLSSRPSSRSSSRPSSYYSSSQGSQTSYSSLPDPEPCTSVLNPKIFDYETSDQHQFVWSDSTYYSIPEYSTWPADYPAVDHSSLPIYDSRFPPALMNIWPAQYPESTHDAKLQMSSNLDPRTDPFEYPRYLYPVALESPFDCNPSELGPDDSISRRVSRREPVRDHCAISPNLNSGKVLKDLKAHLLTHSKERTEKCPIADCEYHVKGFCRKYDKQRHTLTHFKGTFVCNFCPDSGTPAVKTFQRADVFKRHLVSIHGAEYTPAPSSRKISSRKYVFNTLESSTGHWPRWYGNCSNCSVIYDDAQSFYNHLDECVISSVLRQASVSSTNTSKTGDSDKFTSAETVHHAAKPREVMKKPEVINEVEESGRKRRNNYPPSWEAPIDQMKMKKRVMCAFDGTRRLWKDEMMFTTDFETNNLEASMAWSRMESFANDLDGLRMMQPEVCFEQNLFTEEDKFPAYIDTNLFPDDGSLSSIGTKLSKFPDVERAFATWVRNSEKQGIELSDAAYEDKARLFAATVDNRENQVEGNSKNRIEKLKPMNSISAGIPVKTARKTNVPEPQKLRKGRRNGPLSPRAAQNALKMRAKVACMPFVVCKETSEPDIKKEADLIFSSCPDIKPSTADTPGIDCESFAPSPETDVSEEFSDSESISDCSTDWGDDQKTSTPGSDIYKVLANTCDSRVAEEKNLLRPVLSPMKQALVDRIMDEFWTIVNQEWAANLTKCAGETPASSSPPGSNGNLIGGSSPQMANRKRQRDDGEEPPPDDNNGRTPKRPNSQPEKTPPKNGVKFACPYRKHAPHRYSIYKHRSCALSHWDTVARVKEHLYRRHRVPIQCKRCWQTFKVQEALDAHLTVVNICSLQTGQATEGLTADLEKKLKSRKKSSPDQTEEARWKEIYGLLFPNEVVPNPYFEPVQENGPLSPDSRELADYEEYSRQELPRYFRSYLEDAVNNETQHLEEHMRSHLVSIVQDCQARMFSAYKSRTANKDSKPTPESAAIDACVTPPASQVSAEDAVDPVKVEPKNLVASAYQAPPPTPQSTLQYVPDLLDIQSRNMLDKIPENISFSDSAYSSNGTANSQSIPIQSQPKEFLQPKPPGNLYSKVPLGDNKIAVADLQDLSFDDAYNIPLDLNDPAFDAWWENLEPEN